MPTLSRWFIKTGLLYLVIGLVMGVVVFAQPVMGWSPMLATLRPVYLHCLFIGWVSQLIMGVGYWMFPKQTKDNPRGSRWLGWGVYITLNLGMALRVVGEPLVVIAPDAGLGWILAAAAIFLLLAGWGFIFNTWGRIKER